MFGYGYFGSIAERYDKFRPTHSDEVIDYCCSLARYQGHKVLDLGCGTGISTRQLANVLDRVTGCDKDEKMLSVAKRHDLPDIKYIVGTAEKLPFKSETFNIIAAFSAFHWFMNREAVNEIKRVLISGGVFISVNRNKIGLSREIQKRIREMIQIVATREILDIKEYYKPAEFIEANGLEQVQEKSFREFTYYEAADLVSEIKTASIVNEIPPEIQESVLLRIEKLLISVSKSNGFIEWPLEVIVVSGKKP